MAPSCAKCSKAVYPMEAIQAGELVFHKVCFKCSTCSRTLNLKSFQNHENEVYCMEHVPKAKATAVADSVATRQALSAPKKAAEGLGTAQKGTGDRPSQVADMTTSSALNAPKRAAEGLGTAQKGSGDRPSQVADMRTVSALNAPKKKAEGIGARIADPSTAPKAADFTHNQQGGDQSTESEPQYAAAHEEAPAAHEEPPQEHYEEAPQEHYEEAPAEEAPAEEAYAEEPQYEGGEGGGEEYAAEE